MAETPTGRSGGGPKRRGPPKTMTVETVERLTPRLTKVTFTGEELAQFGPPRPGAHIKLLFAPDGSGWSPQDQDAPRPPSRTYTPRRFDARTRRLEVEFVHHGDGLASNWAEGAKPGDQMFVGGPGGGYDVPQGPAQIVLVADDTALPAAGTILDVLAPDVRPVVLAEISHASEERPLTAASDHRPQWLHREPAGAVAGTLLERAVKELESDARETYWWIACEAAAMRRIRDFLIKERKVEATRIHTRGYWKLGETNYPDHDYGDG